MPSTVKTLKYQQTFFSYIARRGLRQSGHEPLRYADTELDHELLDQAMALADALLRTQSSSAISATLSHWPSLAGEHLRS